MLRTPLGTDKGPGKERDARSLYGRYGLAAVAAILTGLALTGCQSSGNQGESAQASGSAAGPVSIQPQRS